MLNGYTSGSEVERGGSAGTAEEGVLRITSGSEVERGGSEALPWRGC